MKKTRTVFLVLFIFLIACTFLFLVSFVSGEKNNPYAFPKLDHFPPMPVSAENPVTNKGQELGRFLFYDPILSADSSFSCAGCHKQTNAFSDSPNQFSNGVTKKLQIRNTLPLFNLAWYPRLFWDGRASSIEEQVYHPVRDKNEMNLNWSEAVKKIKRSKFYRQKFKDAYGKKTIDSILICKAIAQFERTLISCNSKFDKVIRKEAKLTMDELEGYELVNDMTKAGCVHCHVTDGHTLGTTAEFSNNGLDEIKPGESFRDPGFGKITRKLGDNGKFKTPSLRNLLYTAPYMHDGRFKTLEEVLDFYSEGIMISPTIDSRMEFAHKGGSHLTPAEKHKIILFLNTMSDSSFTLNKEFSNPFVK